MRRGELLGLRWDDVDLVRGLVTVRNNLVRVGKELQLKSPKTEDSSRTLSLSGPMLIQLMALCSKKIALKSRAFSAPSRMLRMLFLLVLFSLPF